MVLDMHYNPHIYKRALKPSIAYRTDLLLI